MPTVRARNDPEQYDDLVAEWWQPYGAFAMLHWLAAGRAALLPPASSPGAVLVDLGCGGGVLAPHASRLGYRHVGIDLIDSALRTACRHGVRPVRADVSRVPLASRCAAAVSAGELLEHVPDPTEVVAEACRVLRPGGTLVLDTINATALARLVVVTLGERVPGGAPKGIHDPNLFVPPRVLVDECARHGVRLRVRGVRPALSGMLRWLIGRRMSGALAGAAGRQRSDTVDLAPPPVRVMPTWSTAVLYQGVGVKEA